MAGVYKECYEKFRLFFRPDLGTAVRPDSYSPKKSEPRYSKAESELHPSLRFILTSLLYSFNVGFGVAILTAIYEAVKTVPDDIWFYLEVYICSTFVYVVLFSLAALIGFMQNILTTSPEGFRIRVTEPDIEFETSFEDPLFYNGIRREFRKRKEYEFEAESQLLVRKISTRIKIVASMCPIDPFAEPEPQNSGSPYKQVHFRASEAHQLEQGDLNLDGRESMNKIILPSRTGARGSLLGNPILSENSRRKGSELSKIFPNTIASKAPATLMKRRLVPSYAQKYREQQYKRKLDEDLEKLRIRKLNKEKDEKME